MSRPHPCVAILGPTAAGKTALSLQIAERFGGEIVNYDSVQIYRHFDIGTAKPSADERARVPHHLVGSVEPDELSTAGDFARVGRETLERVRERGTIPVLVGGTGLYLRAVLHGLFSGPARDEDLRQRLERLDSEKPGGYLQRVLRRLDPQASETIHRNDSRKIIRAIEVVLLGGRSLASQWSEGQKSLSGFAVLRLGLDPPRDQLYERINARSQALFDQGLVEEVAALLEKGISRDVRAFGSLGYAQSLAHLAGELTFDEAVAATAQATRRYSKRQMTWFRHQEPDARWWAGFGDSAEALTWANHEVEQWLAAH